MTSYKSVGDVRHLTALKIMMELDTTELTDDQCGELTQTLLHDHELWSEENKDKFYTVATKFAKDWVARHKSQQV